MKFFLHTSEAPEPIGPYSQGIMAQGSLIFLSGQIPMNTDGEIVGDNVAAQTRQVIRNIELLLGAAESRIGDVVKATVFLKNMGDFAEMNKVYEEYFGESKPARSTVEVARLPKDVLVEIEVIAVRA